MTKLASKLAAIMGAIETLKKDEKHQQGWSFTSVGAMYDAVRPLLAEQGVVIIPKMTGVKEEVIGKTSKGSPINSTIAKFDMLITDGETEISVPWEAKALDYDDKGINKCATSAMKYFIKTTFLISTSDEPDPDHSQVSSQIERPKTQPRSQPVQARAQEKPSYPWQLWKSAEDAQLWADEQADQDGVKLFNHPSHITNAYEKAKREYMNSLPKNSTGEARAMWRYWFEKVEAKRLGQEFTLPTHGSQKLFDPIEETDGLSFEDVN